MNKLLYISLLTLIFLSCEDKIDLDVPNGEAKLVVDGKMTNGDSLQTVTLSSTSPYFETSRTPRVSGAEVYVMTSDDERIDFVENQSRPGDYECFYGMNDTGLTFILNIITPDGIQYQSFPEKLNRVPPIDSIYQSDETRVSPGPDGIEGYYAMIDTKEPKGRGDYYRWIIFLNGEQSISPFDLIIQDDRLVDGNEIREWDIEDELQPGDFLEIHQTSISQRAFSYWSLVFQQLTNFGSPFDTPPAPIEGNIFNVNDPDETVLGFFGVSKVEKAYLNIVIK